MTIAQMKVSYTYLKNQFPPASALATAIFRRIEDVLARGEFTLGREVAEFEEAWATQCGTRWAVGVNSGTDAIKLILRALGVGPGDSVITVPNSFVATVGAILEIGARPIFMDIGTDHLMLPEEEYRPKVPPGVQLSSYPKWRMPVHWGGNVSFSNKPHVEDASQAVGATYNGRPAGSLGVAAAFSLHPLKNVNVWGDGGVVTTNDEGLAEEVRLLRNHGLIDRDTCVKPGYNSRLDTIQAIVGLEVLKDLERVTEARIANALYYDLSFANLKQVTVPRKAPGVKQVYHLYQIEAKNRAGLIKFLAEHNVEAKIHYPIPLHLMLGLKFLGYEKGDFPGAEWFADNHVSLPIHQYLTKQELQYVVEMVHEFYEHEP